MAVVVRRQLRVDSRNIMQNAKLAIVDIFDAIVELVTNADDRYQILGKSGRVDIEVMRKRQGTPSILGVRDFADGMTNDTMDLKLSKIGGRVSGMEKGFHVRGTNSRGAKDVAALGPVTFESIAVDGFLHRCRINEFFFFELENSEEVSVEDRSRLGILEGTGTLVTIAVNSNKVIPQHRELVRKVSSLVSLRDIIKKKKTEIFVRDLGQQREDKISPLSYVGNKRLSQRFSVSGYPGKEAKLVIYRAHRPFKSANRRFRKGGILIKSKHAIHEATLFDKDLERDPCAAWFYGRLSCQSIDDLWNEYDQRQAGHLPELSSNPMPILDPSRKSGLVREHPFVSALFKEALKRLRPLVEEERRRQQSGRARLESDHTRKRLDVLGKAANKFIAEYSDEEEASRDPNGRETGSRFRVQGYVLSPPFAQIVVGHSRKCRLSVLQQVFPELESGDMVQVDSLTAELDIDRRFTPLEPNPVQDGVLQAVWSIKGAAETKATGFRARVGPISSEGIIEILGSEAERYSDIKTLEFAHKIYRIRASGPKRVKLLAPLNIVKSSGLRIETDASEGFSVSVTQELAVKSGLGVATAELLVSVKQGKFSPAGVLTARLGDYIAKAKLMVAPEEGTGITIKLEDVSHGAQRYRWKNNLLEIAARHPSLARYIGPKSEQYPGQEERHFRVLLSEIVADAVCSQVLRHNIEANPLDFEDADWDRYYAEFSELMDRFLPMAHELVVPDTN